jgi:hypothetical protein
MATVLADEVDAPLQTARDGASIVAEGRDEMTRVV